jgi:hypothetical protein
MTLQRDFFPEVLVCLLVLFSASRSGASDVKVIGPCNSSPVFSVQAPVGNLPISLGDFTIEVFKKHNLSFVGDRFGIKSILNSPVGDEALEVLSDSEMRAYGWCVSLDGKQPNQMPDEVLLDSNVKEIIWFYAFATYEKGTWRDYCTPSHQVRSPFICH